MMIGHTTIATEMQNSFVSVEGRDSYYKICKKQAN